MKNTMRNSKLLKESMRGSVRHLAGGAAATVGAVFFAFLIPLSMSFILDYVLLGDNSQLLFFFNYIADRFSSAFLLENIWLVALGLIALSAINGIFSFIRGHETAVASERIAKKMRNRMYSHIQDVPYEFHKHASAGDIVQRCSSDIDTIRRFVSVQVLELVRTIVMIVLALFIMFGINVKMTFITICLLPLLLAVSAGFFLLVRKQFTLSDEAEGKLMTVLQENLSGARTVRAFGQQNDERLKFEQTNLEYKKINLKLNKIMGYFWGFTDIIGSLQIVLAVAFGAYHAVIGAISLGNFLVFYLFALQLTWPIRQLGRILADFSKATVSLSRLDEIIAVEVEKEPGKALTPEIHGKIEFKDVHFAYSDGNEDVLDGVTFTIEPGQTVAILGSTGSGKTSLVHLLQRLYGCTGGEILVDGVNVNDIERHHLRKNIGMVLQEPFLYSRTIEQNLKITNPDISDDRMFEAARIASVHDVITTFDKGYDTVVGERGVTLSGGQKQRVAIARMLMQNAPILVLDDSMSAVDTETDSAIRAALRGRRKDITTIIISHRITTLSEADFIVVLEDGKVTQLGDHQALLKQDGLYRRIAEVQALSEESIVKQAKGEA